MFHFRELRLLLRRPKTTQSLLAGVTPGGLSDTAQAMCGPAGPRRGPQCPSWAQHKSSRSRSSQDYAQEKAPALPPNRATLPFAFSGLVHICCRLLVPLAQGG